MKLFLAVLVVIVVVALVGKLFPTAATGAGASKSLAPPASGA